MTSRILILFIIGIFFLCPSPLLAKSMYITDRIEIGLRSGRGIEQHIIRMLKSGEQVEVLDGDKDWSKVRVADGTVGWVASRFLVEQKRPASWLDPKMLEEIRGLKEKNTSLARENDLNLKEKNKLLESIEDLKKQIQILQQRKIPPSPPELNELKLKNEKLGNEIIQYKKQTELSRKNKGNDQNQIKWFLAGSSVLLFGLLLGWLISRGRRKPYRYY
jgi:SH3 domain protein